MSDNENNEVNQEQQEVDYKALYEDAKKDLDSLVAKKDELLGETKKAKQAKNEMLEKMQELENQKAQDMQQNGEFEKLWQSEQHRAKELEGKLNEFKSKVRQEKVNTMSLKVANDLSKGKAENAELLSVFIGQSLNEYADDLGNIDANVLDSVKKQFLADKKYAPLLGGSMATGGGAVGGKPGSAQRSEISRREFDQMNPADRMEFIKKGGRTFDE
jgi:chromosome segregation ATPase